MPLAPAPLRGGGRVGCSPADALTLLFGLAAFHAAVLGGFQIPGLSVRNPWRPLVLALAVGGLRVGLTHKASLYRWFRSIGGHLQSDGRAAAPHERRADAIFFRTLDLLVVWVVSVSYVSIALLALDAYDATTAVIAGIIVTTVVRFFTPARLDSAGAGPSRPILPVLLLVLLAALLFRTDPFRTMHGGQDQGLYVSMSGYLQREGKVFIDDPLPGVLPDRQLREIYGAGQPAEPSFGAAVQPGVYYSHTQGDYVFQFYHLHSLWMATFADLFGDGARFYALTFFGLLSVLGLCLLTLELSGSRSATMAVGLLLAVNPLHAFFSRFPVTEVVALAFSSLGIYYLVRAFRGMRNASPAGTTASVLVLATGCVSLVFFVRITGFLYLPALVPLFGFGAWAMLGSREIRGRQLVGFCSVVAVMYGVSVLYGLRYSPVYSLSIYNRTFGGALGEGWPLVTLGAAVLTVTALAAVAWNRHRTPVRRLLDWAVDPRPWTWLATTLVAGAVLGSVYQAYLIGFTERYADNAFYARFDIIGIGADIFLQSGAAAWLLYVSPLLVVALIWGMHRPDRPSAAVLLYVFLAVCLAANLVLNVPVIYRHYYYARYLISEVVPYSLVLAVAVIAHAGPGTFRRLGVLAILATMPFHLFFTTKQMPVRYGSAAVFRSDADCRSGRGRRSVARRRTARLLPPADAPEPVLRHARVPLCHQGSGRNRPFVRGCAGHEPVAAYQRSQRPAGTAAGRDVRLPRPADGRRAHHSRHRQRTLLAAGAVPVSAAKHLRNAGLRVAPRRRPSVCHGKPVHLRSEDARSWLAPAGGEPRLVRPAADAHAFADLVRVRPLAGGAAVGDAAVRRVAGSSCEVECRDGWRGARDRLR